MSEKGDQHLLHNRSQSRIGLAALQAMIYWTINCKKKYVMMHRKGFSPTYLSRRSGISPAAKDKIIHQPINQLILTSRFNKTNNLETYKNLLFESQNDSMKMTEQFGALLLLYWKLAVSLVRITIFDCLASKTIWIQYLIGCHVKLYQSYDGLMSR